MKRASKLILVLGVMLALLGGGMLFLYLTSMGGAAAQTTPPVNIVVAAKDIPSYKPIAADMLQLKSLPPEAVSPENVRDLSAAVGKALNTPAKPGQHILTSTLTEGGFAYNVPKDKKVIAIFTDRLSVLNGLMREGDFVDVVFMGNFPQVNASEGKDGRYADQKSLAPTGKVVVQNVQVLKLQNPAESNIAGAVILPENLKLSAGGSTEGATELWTVMLAVTDKEAEVLRYAQTTGIVSLVMRANGDKTVEETTGVSEEIMNNERGVPVPLQPEK